MLRTALPDIAGERLKKVKRRLKFKKVMVMFWGRLFSIGRFTGIYMRRVWIPFPFGFFLGAVWL